MHTHINKLFIDIETIPCQQPDLCAALVERIAPPSNYKDPEKIAAWKADKTASVVAATGLDGTFGEVCCIGVALDNAAPIAFTGHETDILSQFIDYLVDDVGVMTHPMWIGHNICGFDLRYLWQRHIIHGLRMPVGIPHNAKPWSDGVFDTLYEWCGADTRNHGLDMLCQVFGIATKPHKSSEVAELHRAGNLQAIEELCLHDVRATRELYRLMRQDETIEEMKYG